MGNLNRFKDVGSGVAFFLLSVAIFINADSIRVFAPNSGNYINAQFFPKLIAGLLGVISVAQIIAGVRLLFRSDIPEEPAMGREGWFRIVSTLGLLVIYVALLTSMGFLIMTILYVFFQTLILTPRESWRIPFIVGLSTVFSTLVYLMFTQVFSLILPRADFMPF